MVKMMLIDFLLKCAAQFFFSQTISLIGFAAFCNCGKYDRLGFLW